MPSTYFLQHEQATESFASLYRRLAATRTQIHEPHHSQAKAEMGEGCAQQLLFLAALSPTVRPGASTMLSALML